MFDTHAAENESPVDVGELAAVEHFLQHLAIQAVHEENNGRLLLKFYATVARNWYESTGRAARKLQQHQCSETRKLMGAMLTLAWACLGGLAHTWPRKRGHATRRKRQQHHAPYSETNTSNPAWHRPHAVGTPQPEAGGRQSPPRRARSVTRDTPNHLEKQPKDLKYHGKYLQY